MKSKFSKMQKITKLIMMKYKKKKKTRYMKI